MKPKTATASFRLDESALNALQEDARKQNVSVNTLLNQLVLAYANYDRPMKRFHMIKVPASSFKHILEAATSEAVIEAGNAAGKDVPNTYIRAKWGELTVENALNYLKTTADYTNPSNTARSCAPEGSTSPLRTISAPREACFCSAMCRRSSSRWESRQDSCQMRMRLPSSFSE